MIQAIDQSRPSRRSDLNKLGPISSLPQLPESHRSPSDALHTFQGQSLSTIKLPPLVKSMSHRLSILETNKATSIRGSKLAAVGSSRRAFSYGPTQTLRNGKSGTLETVKTATVRDYAYVTKQGEVMNSPKSHNQDAALLVQSLAGHPDTHLFGIFDGHGLYGHDVSGYLRDHMTEFVVGAIGKNIAGGPEALSDALKSGFRMANAGIRKAGVDYTYSGSTCLTVLLEGSLCLCAHVGDSRAIIGRKTGLNDWRPIPISIDHKPTIPEEHNRIINAGGKIAPYYNSAGVPNGPLRVWLKNQKIPGLAMTRSIGDAVATRVGVSSEAEVQQLFLTQDERFLVLATDGLWEVLTNEDVVSLASKYYETSTCAKCCDSLLREALRRWKRTSESCDDITIIVVFLA